MSRDSLRRVVIAGGGCTDSTWRLDRAGSVATVSSWGEADPGVLALPSGRLVRGRGLCRPMPAGQAPEFAVHLLATASLTTRWDSRWVQWPDFSLPADRVDARDALQEAWRRAASQRVEVACGAGRGRTGTALACIAVIDGVPAAEAVAYVRAHYDPRAVETHWQRRYVARFPGT